MAAPGNEPTTAVLHHDYQARAPAQKLRSKPGDRPGLVVLVDSRLPGHHVEFAGWIPRHVPAGAKRQLYAQTGVRPLRQLARQPLSARRVVRPLAVRLAEGVQLRPRVLRGVIRRKVRRNGGRPATGPMSLRPVGFPRLIRWRVQEEEAEAAATAASTAATPTVDADRMMASMLANAGCYDKAPRNELKEVLDALSIA